MALKKEKKTEIVSELSTLFGTSKMTVVAKYRGLTVKAMQQLRKDAEENQTTVKVVKNRLVRKALENNESTKNVDKTTFPDAGACCTRARHPPMPSRAREE